uniref:TNFR-Cys domain-containing protein n=1 Tax=Denticeps clupeoides TaxID=299321 RepID=A0AAY4BCG6_9TELE
VYTCVCVCVCPCMGVNCSSKEPCESGQFTASGDCCEECPPGEGVVVPCGAKQTICGQCMDSETFSEASSHTETCQPCTQCTGLMRMHTPCTDTNDALCVCDYGYFLNWVTQACEPCTVCPPGQGVLSACQYDQDSVCEPCLDQTFSDQESSLDPCLPCNICEEETEILLRSCTPTSDRFFCCSSNFLFSPSPPLPSAPTFTLLDGSWSPTPGEELTTAYPSSPRFIGLGFNENLIPIYCSILAAVVVGLLAYIVFKRWNSCKQNKQAANNRAATANQTPSPEGEKLHSDSGISVDSQSLPEQLAAQAQSRVPEQIGKRDSDWTPLDGGVFSLWSNKKDENVLLSKQLNRERETAKLSAGGRGA